MEVTVKDRQTLFDISVQCLGGIEGVFALAERNNLSITALLKDSRILMWENEDTVNVGVQKTYAERGLFPATDMEQSEYDALLVATAPPKAETAFKPTDETLVYTDKIDEILADIQAGKDVVPESSLSLTRIFDNPFDIVFA